jgi:hypothetical protein
MTTHPARTAAGDQEIAPAKAKRVRVRVPKGAPERYADWVWQAHQIATYMEKSMKGREDRAERAARERRRRARGLAEGVVMAPMSSEFIRRAEDTKCRTLGRLRDGYVFRGGAVGGNDAYRREPFVYHGLVSGEHPILQAFVSRVRRRKHMRVGGTKADSYSPASKLEGLDEAYIEGNKVVCGLLRVEIDRVLTVNDIESACRAANVPLPNIVVGWKDQNGTFHRPHLIWLLHEGVPLQGVKCGRFLSLYRGVLRGLTLALLPIGADPGGLCNSHRHKNPLCPEWHREVLGQQPYDLSALKSCVDVTVRMSDLRERAAGLSAGRSVTARSDHPDPAVATASNSVFRLLASWARKKIGIFRAEGIDEIEFGDRVADEACRIAGVLTGDAPRSAPAALRLARTVTRWTWNVHKMPVPKPAKLSPDKLRAARAKGGKMVSAARKDASFELIGWAASTIVAAGGKLRQAAVLDLVRPLGIKSIKTIGRHWKAVRVAVESGNRMFAPPPPPTSESVRGNEAAASSSLMMPACLRRNPVLPRPLPPPFLLLPMFRELVSHRTAGSVGVARSTLVIPCG